MAEGYSTLENHFACEVMRAQAICLALTAGIHCCFCRCVSVTRHDFACEVIFELVKGFQRVERRIPGLGPGFGLASAAEVALPRADIESVLVSQAVAAVSLLRRGADYLGASRSARSTTSA